MKKKKIILILLLLYILIFGVNTTYSMYKSDSNSELELSFAKIIFNNEKLNNFSLPINNLIPGEPLEYQFMISNEKDGNISEIAIGYSIIIETFNIIPVDIRLYNINNETPIVECNDENFNRNIENKLICNSENFELKHNEETTNNYKLVISFDEYNPNNEIWSDEYSDLIDFIDIKINSWQIVE
jgi:hypothetical protein